MVQFQHGVPSLKLKQPINRDIMVVINLDCLLKYGEPEIVCQRYTDVMLLVKPDVDTKFAFSLLVTDGKDLKINNQLCENTYPVSQVKQALLSYYYRSDEGTKV